MKFIEKYSLKKRFLFIVFPAIVSLFAASYLLIYGSFKNYQDSHQLAVSAEYLFRVSEYIHTAQKERMISAGFYKGTFSASELQNQRGLVDDKRNHIKEYFDQLHASDLQRINEQFKVHDQLREMVSSKQNLPQVLEQWGAFIRNLMVAQSERIKLYSFAGINSKLQSLITLEASKESAGKLRAKLTAVLSENVAIEQKEVLTISALESGILTTIKMPNMIVSAEIKKSIEDVFASNEWKHIQHVIGEIDHKAHEGHYDIDAKETAAKITAIIENVAGFINKESHEVQNYADEISAKAKSDLITELVLLILVVFLILFTSYSISQQIIKSLLSIEDSLNQNAAVVGSSASQLSSASQGLSSATAEQAASLTETSTAMDEINSMVQKNVEASKQTAKFASESKQSATQGQQLIKKLMSAIEEIKQSNVEFAKAVDDSNQQFSKIVQVINSIESKTKVINDIVFQTKLLSFNASVEAARAGEHGRGFAVVAEEVGGLAEMSGNSAKEISSMLSSSVQQVQSITRDTATTMSRMMQASQEKVDIGIQHARDCEEILHEIVEKIDRTSDLTSSIASASEEQALGVQEVMQAINSLNDVVQLNSATSQQTASSSNELNTQAESLVVTLKSLSHVIKGDIAA